MEQGLTKNQIVQELMRSTHASVQGRKDRPDSLQRLEKFIPVVEQAAQFEPEFLAHLTAWNQKNGQVRDSMIALPVGSLRRFNRQDHLPLHENALAHLAIQSPRNFLRGLKFGIAQKVPGRRNQFRRLVGEYLHFRESRWPLWCSAVVTHRDSMEALYAMFRVKPSVQAKAILFEHQMPKGTVFWDIKHLKEMSDAEAASTILRHGLPMAVVTGAWQGKKLSEGIVFAMLKNMSPTEVVTNMKALKEWGVTQTPALRGLLSEAIEKVATSKANVLKTGHKAKEVAVVDKDLARRMEVAQQKQLQAFKVKANVAVFGDASGSMQRSIELAKKLAAFLSSVVEGKVYLVFMNTTPRALEVTGKSYPEIQEMCKYIRAGGATSLGCGLELLLEHGVELDLITMVSDGAENTSPRFADVLKRYQAHFNVDLPVCHYWMKCDQPNRTNNNPEGLANSMERVGLAMQVIDLREIGDDIDYYSLPNLVATMQTRKYGLIDAIMDTPLLTRAQVFS